jgi:hypothetical protein
MTPGPFLVIVHRSGWVDLETLPAFWTEVPAHAACAADGATSEEAVSRTRESLRHWTGHDPRVEVFVAG